MYLNEASLFFYDGFVKLGQEIFVYSAQGFQNSDIMMAVETTGINQYHLYVSNLKLLNTRNHKFPVQVSQNYLCHFGYF